jgi:hypothetical protein
MKKTILAAILVLAVAAAAAWGQETVEELDGFHWLKLSRREKSVLVEGYWLAEIAVERAMAFDLLGRQDLTEEERRVGLEEISARFRTPGTIGDMIDEIDQQYADYGTREVPLWFVLGAVHHPDWYNPAPAKGIAK